MRSFSALKKFALFLGIFIAFILFLLPVFYNKTDNKIHIQFSSWGSESEISILKPLLKEFELQNPDIKVDFMHIPQNYFQKIHLLYASNTAPDVVFINNLYLPVYANAGVLEDLSNYGFEFDKFFDNSVVSMSWKSGIYAVPRDVSNLVIFYNKDLFRKYNVPLPKSGWTYDEFLNTALRLTKGDILGVSFDENPLYFLSYLVMYGEWNNDDTINYFNDDVFSKPEIQKALNFYADLRHKYHVAPLKEELGSMTNGQMFLQGRLGMYFSGRWMVPKLREDANFDWDVVEFPPLNKGEKSPVLSDSSGWALSKSSKHKKEAVQLIKFLSSKEVSSKFTKSGLIVPARKDVAYSEVFNDGKKPLNSKVFLEIAQKSRPTPVTVNYNEILDDLKKRTEYIFNR